MVSIRPGASRRAGPPGAEAPRPRRSRSPAWRSTMAGMDRLLDRPAERQAAEEKAYAAEHAIAWLRCVVVLCNTALYLGMDWSRTSVALAWGIIALSFVYSVAVLATKAWRRFPVLRESHLTAVADMALALAWIHATGGADSPFYPLLYGIGVANAFRFGVLESTLMAFGLAGAYVLLVAASAAHIDATTLMVRGVYVPIIAALAALWARETLAQTAARIEIEGMVRDLKAAERRLRELLDAAPEAVLVVDGEGRLREVNREAEQLFGAPSARLFASNPRGNTPAVRCRLARAVGVHRVLSAELQAGPSGIA